MILKLNARKKLLINIRWLKYVHIRKSDNNRVGGNMNPKPITPFPPLPFPPKIVV
jgi:hypothetical protein